MSLICLFDGCTKMLDRDYEVDTGYCDQHKHIATDYYPLLKTEVISADKTEAIKYDEDKIRYDLLPQLGLLEIAKVFTVGSKKYGDENWRGSAEDNYKKAFTYKRCLAALFRHLCAWIRGEDCDVESGLHHLSAVAFYCLVIMEYHFDKNRYGQAGLDNRIKVNTIV